MTELARIFKSVVKGKNFMTPNVDGFFRRGKYVIELSYSNYNSFCGYQFGVTIVDARSLTRCFEFDKAFCDENRDDARRKALDYIESIS